MRLFFFSTSLKLNLSSTKIIATRVDISQFINDLNQFVAKPLLWEAKKVFTQSFKASPLVNRDKTIRTNAIAR